MVNVARLCIEAYDNVHIADGVDSTVSQGKGGQWGWGLDRKEAVEPEVYEQSQHSLGMFVEILVSHKWVVSSIWCIQCVGPT